MKKTLSIALVLILALSLFACGGSSPTPTDVTNEFLQAIKDKDNDTIKTVYAGGNINVEKEFENMSESEDDAISKVYAEKLYGQILSFDYEVSNEQVKDDTATVDVAITTYNIGDTFKDFVTDYIGEAFAMSMSGASDEELNQKATEIITEKLDGMKKNYSQTITLNLSQKDGEWMVDKLADDSDFYNAISGGILDATKEIEESFSF